MGDWFQLLGLANATVLWSSHGRALRALGATRAEFYREVRRELGRFTRQLRKEAAARPCRQAPVGAAGEAA